MDRAGTRHPGHFDAERTVQELWNDEVSDTVPGVGTTRHVALLRGINVGGRNAVAMADLQEAFEAGGYGAVSTYIRTGNVLFESAAQRATMAATKLLGLLDARTGAG